MPPVIKLGDQNELIPTSKFPSYAKFGFINFNPVQSRVFEYYDKDMNGVIAAATSAGKTCVAEMFLSHEVRKRGGKGMYLSPLRALAQEKLDDWKSDHHHFHDLNISACTGDYQLTDKRRIELESANLILFTSEMLNSRCRNFNYEKNKFLLDVKTLVIDEAHLLGVSGRGDHLESGLMKFTSLNPGCRLVLLSATMPNVDEIAEWVSYTLTGRDTFLIKSKYRPCPLTMHYEKYFDGGKSYDDTEGQKINAAMGIINYYPEDKFIVFAHTKKTGELMKTALQRVGIDCEFHNADLEKSKRIAVGEKFKNDPKFRVIVATSTLAQGLNLPARRVVILGVHRGMGEVEPHDIIQMCGRAGRPQYDPMGDAYILLPEKDYEKHKEKLKKPQRIESQLLGDNHKTLAFHLVSEIHQESITDASEVLNWYKRSLAYFQSNELDVEVVNKTIDSLKKCRAIWEESGKLSATTVGKVASMFYFTPFDVNDLSKNFEELFEGGNEDSDIHLAMALGNLDVHRCGFVSKQEREEINKFQSDVEKVFGNRFKDNPAVKPAIKERSIKAGYVYYNLLNGLNSQVMSGFANGLRYDFPRLSQVIQCLGGFTGKWHKKDWFELLNMRISYGVKGPMARLCQLPDVGRARAQKLYAAGIKSLEDVVASPARVKAALGFKQDKIDEIIQQAEGLLLLGSN